MEQKAKDRIRTKFLNDQGIRVLRFWDNDVLKESEAVREAIYRALTEGNSIEIPPHPNPLPEGEGAGGAVASDGGYRQ